MEYYGWWWRVHGSRCHPSYVPQSPAVVVRAFILSNWTLRLIINSFIRPGTALYKNVYTDEASCTSLGFCWPSALYNTEADCLGRYFCEGCADCFDEPTCALAGKCSDFNGCHLPFNDDGNCDTTAEWTPLGCHDGSINETSTCQAMGG